MLLTVTFSSSGPCSLGREGVETHWVYRILSPASIMLCKLQMWGRWHRSPPSSYGLGARVGVCSNQVQKSEPLVPVPPTPKLCPVTSATFIVTAMAGLHFKQQRLFKQDNRLWIKL
jgi:hypothetical protein